MKFKGDRKYLYMGLTGLTIVCGGMLFYYVLFFGANISSIISSILNILTPFIIGFTIAYILTPVVNTIERRAIYPIYKKIKKDKAKPFAGKLKKKFRVVSVIIGYLLFIFVIVALVWMIIPEVYKNITNIATLVPESFNKLYGGVRDFVTNGNAITVFLKNTFNIDLLQMLNNINLNDIIASATQYLSGIGNLIGSVSSTIIMTLKMTLNVIIGIVCSVYFLMGKERFAAQAKKLAFAIFQRRNANRLIKDMRFIHKTFIGFLAGKVVDSLIIGILCFIGLTILNTHYVVLVSVIVGVTNIIPFFGPYLGAIPSAFLLLLVSPMDCLVFVIFIIILQQIDGNIIGPKILGNTTGLSGFWVIFGITFFGAIYGFFGMLIGVPVFAVIYAFAKRYLNRKLAKKELPEETEAYEDLYEMGEDNEIVHKEHNYIEIRNPDAVKKKKGEDDKYHFSIVGMFDNLQEKIRGGQSKSKKSKGTTTETHSETSNGQDADKENKEP